MIVQIVGIEVEQSGMTCSSIALVRTKVCSKSTEIPVRNPLTTTQSSVADHPHEHANMVTAERDLHPLYCPEQKAILEILPDDNEFK